MDKAIKNRKKKNNFLLPIIELKNLVKTYQTEAGVFPVLKGINLAIQQGEFVGVIGKSGSGKSTLINMLSGIDRPSSGEILVNETPIHDLTEDEMAQWRGLHLGIVFQFFQLLPTLTVMENVMLPMDFCHLYTPKERWERAWHLLKLVEVADQANKLPGMISGGQQQRVAIARALANDPPVIVADEPTGNLDSKTAEQVFRLFEKLVNDGKTIVMVTHDSDQAKRLGRTLIIADGEIIEEYLAQTFPALNERQLIWMTSRIRIENYAPGEMIIKKGAGSDKLYIVIQGQVEILLDLPGGQELAVTRMTKGNYFGEIELLQDRASVASARAAIDGEVKVAVLDRATFNKLLADSKETRQAIDKTAQERFRENIARRRKG
ncbi:MAG TPA: ATP-binding cassette domain-containing protein [Candidatus Bathyarchaeia archaeon]|nr:ATP-binding cassette domain-containing protein [Candidatus Bathyarchaeia archaeon]